MQTSNMKKFLIKVITFFALLAILDYATGKVLDYLSVHAKGGITQRDNYICDELETEPTIVQHLSVGYLRSIKSRTSCIGVSA